VSNEVIPFLQWSSVCLSVCLSLPVAHDYVNADEVYKDISNAAALKINMMDLLAVYNNLPVSEESI